MAQAFYTFYFNVTSLGADLSEEQLAAVGSDAWKRVDKAMQNWPGRSVQVQESDFTLDVQAIELCEDDVGMAERVINGNALPYGIGFYTEQRGLVLTQKHLQQVQEMCERAFVSAAVHAGFTACQAHLKSIERILQLEPRSTLTAPSLEALAKIENEVYWVTSNGDQPTGLYFNRDKAFGTADAYLDAFNQAGEKVESYKFNVAWGDSYGEEPCTEAQYTTDF